MKPNPNTEKVRAHRARLRAQGLRPVQLWLPDTRSEAFKEQALRESRAVAAADKVSDDQAFIDSISAWLWE